MWIWNVDDKVKSLRKPILDSLSELVSSRFLLQSLVLLTTIKQTSIADISPSSDQILDNNEQ